MQCYSVTGILQVAGKQDLATIGFLQKKKKRKKNAAKPLTPLAPSCE